MRPWDRKRNSSTFIYAAIMILITSMFSITNDEIVLANETLAEKRAGPQAQSAPGEAKKSERTLPFPAIILAHNDVEILNADGAPPSLASGSVLRGRLTIRTGANSSLRIQVDSDRTLFLEPNSKIQIPGISWDRGEFTEIELLNGRVRARGTKSDGFLIHINSPLFSQAWEAGDMVYEMDSEHALAKLYVLEGKASFSALNAEVRVALVGGQQVTFRGQKEDGELAYDILLQGRKIPRGTLEAVTPLGKEELKLWDLADELAKIKAIEAAKKKHKLVEEKLGPGQICRHPKAKFNECAWTCLNNPRQEKNKCLTARKGVSCQRTRCLADGVWGDPTHLSADEGALRCRATQSVAPCDY